MAKALRWLLVAVLCIFAGEANKVKAQNVAISTNALHWAILASPNASLEIALGDKVTLDIHGGLNFWDLKKSTRVRHWVVQPEVRYWFCDKFNGHFIGLHGHGGQYNLGGIDIPLGQFKKLKDNRYEGIAYGAGISYGYQWVLSKHWNVEASIGAGYARVKYDKYPCEECGTKLSKGYYNYWGLTRAKLALVYLF